MLMDGSDLRKHHNHRMQDIQRGTAREGRVSHRYSIHQAIPLVSNDSELAVNMIATATGNRRLMQEWKKSAVKRMSKCQIDENVRKQAGKMTSNSQKPPSHSHSRQHNAKARNYPTRMVRVEERNAADLASTGGSPRHSCQILPHPRVTCQHACKQKLTAAEDLHESFIPSSTLRKPNLSQLWECLVLSTIACACKRQLPPNTILLSNRYPGTLRTQFVPNLVQRNSAKQ